MKYEITMPSLGADMDQGKLIEWKINPGDEIKKNQVIASVETTKSIVDIESFREGKVLELLTKVGDVIPVGKIIASLEIHAEVENSHLKISPVAKKIAEEKHIDISQIVPTGTQGEITLKDIEKKEFLGKNLRLSIASAMARSKKEIPHYYLKRKIYLDSLIKWLDEKNTISTAEERLLIPAVLMRAVILALKKYPQLNGYYINDKFEMSESVNLGTAFALKDEGVLVPAVLEAEKLSLSEFNLAFQNLALRTKNGGLKNRELNEGTITVTNVGDLGSDEVFGIIFPPQVAIVGFGRIRKEPIVDTINQGEIYPGFVIDVTLSADHRVSDGLLGAKFLNELANVLNHPLTL